MTKKDSIMLEIFLTRKCNLHCQHCMYDCSPKSSGEYISDEILGKIKKQVDFLNACNISPVVNLVGGEPTINLSSFERVFKTVSQWDSRLAMTTNGWWLKSKKATERLFEIVSGRVHKTGKSYYQDSSTDFKKRSINIRISNDKFHEEQRKGFDIYSALLSAIENNPRLPKPDPEDPWIWCQPPEDERYYISPNGRGRSVTDIERWIEKFNTRNMCFKDPRVHNPYIHYEVDGTISDACGLGSLYDFGTVEDNILFIIHIIKDCQVWKINSVNNGSLEYSNCTNCRELVQAWKKEYLQKYRSYYGGENTFDVNEFHLAFENIRTLGGMK